MNKNRIMIARSLLYFILVLILKCFRSFLCTIFINNLQGIRIVKMYNAPVIIVLIFFIGRLLYYL